MDMIQSIHGSDRCEDEKIMNSVKENKTDDKEVQAENSKVPELKDLT